MKREKRNSGMRGRKTKKADLFIDNDNVDNNSLHRGDDEDGDYVCGGVEEIYLPLGPCQSSRNAGGQCVNYTDLHCVDVNNNDQQDNEERKIANSNNKDDDNIEEEPSYIGYDVYKYAAAAAVDRLNI